MDKIISDLEYLNQKVKVLLSKHCEYLKTYIIECEPNYLKNENEDKSRHLFTRPRINVTGDGVSEKPGILSTCFALLSFINSDKKIENIINDLNNSEQGKYDNIFKEFIDDLLQYNEMWKYEYADTAYDIYTTPIKLLLLKRYQNKYDKTNNDIKIDNDLIFHALYKMIEHLYYSKPKGVARFNLKYNNSAFLSYIIIRALNEWKDEFPKINSPVFNMWKNKKTGYNPECFPTQERFYEIFKNLNEWAEIRINRQITFYTIDDTDRKNSIRSLYSILIHLLYHNTFSGQKLRSHYKPKIIYKLVSYTLEDLDDRGLWRRYFPIARLGDDGDIYPYSLFGISELLQYIDADDELIPILINSIQTSINWISNNKKEGYFHEYVRNGKIEETNKLFSGWRSPFITNPHGNPECWSTSLIFTALINFNKVISNTLTLLILKKYPTSVPLDIGVSMDKRLDSLLTIDDENKCSLKKTVKKMIIEPIKNNLDSKPNSIILFGPPGTGKTSLVKLIAHDLGWNFRRIDSGTLFKYGIDKSMLSISEVFDDLKDISNTVILFDEIDEVIKTRSDKSTVQNRILTDVLLTKLNDLKENENILYVINTNDICDVDIAIKRDGRFDMLLFIDYIYYKEALEYFKNFINKESAIMTNPNLKSDFDELIDSLEKHLEGKLSNQIGPDRTIFTKITFSGWNKWIYEIIEYVNTGETYPIDSEFDKLFILDQTKDSNLIQSIKQMQAESIIYNYFNIKEILID